MKNFEAPVVAVMEFDVMDVLTTSGTTPPCPEFVDCPNETPEF